MRPALLRTLLFSLALLSPWASVRSEEPRDEAREKLRLAHARLEELKAKGMEAEAKALAAEIEAATRALALREAKEREAAQKPAAREGDDRKERGEILQGLEQGIHALRRMGKNREAEHLLEIAKEFARQPGEAHGEHPERAAARRQIEIMRIAMKGCIDVKRRNEAERLEHAIHVTELNLEGRRDEEANAIRREGPDREERTELLRFSVRALEELGRTDQARLVASLLEGRAPAAQGPETPSRALLERLEHLEGMVRELERQLARIEAARERADRD